MADGQRPWVYIKDESSEVMKKLEADADWKKARDSILQLLKDEMRAKPEAVVDVKDLVTPVGMDRLKIEAAMRDPTGRRQKEVDAAVEEAMSILGRLWGYAAYEAKHRPSWFSFKFQIESSGFNSGFALYIAQKTGFPGTQCAMHRHVISPHLMMAQYIQNGPQGLVNFLVAEGEVHLVDCSKASKVDFMSPRERNELAKELLTLQETNIDTGNSRVIVTLPTKEEIAEVATRAVKRTIRRPEPGKHKGQNSSAATQKHKLLCPTHNEPLGYNAERGRYECPQRANGCAIVHRPPKDTSDEPVLGKAPLDLRIVVTSSDDRIAPNVFLMAQNNVFVDITEHVKDVDLNDATARAVNAARTPGQPNYVDRDEVIITLKLPRTVVIGHDSTID